jgi:hypothetical protein
VLQNNFFNKNLDIMKYIGIGNKSEPNIWTELGKKFNLSLSKCAAFGNKFLGIDKMKRRLLISADRKNFAAYQVIDLQKIKSISLKKRYSSIKAGELTKRKFEDFLKSIHLRFESIDKDVTVFPFYKRGKDNVIDVSTIDLAANNLQSILSKLIGAEPPENRLSKSLL